MIMSSKDRHCLEHDTEIGITTRGFCYRKVSRYKAVGCAAISVLAVMFIATACLSDSFCWKQNSCDLTPVIINNGPSGYDAPFPGECKTIHEGTPIKKLPEAIIIGVRKAGTGAMRFYLDMHPYIEISNAELNFFDFEYENGLEWYKEQLPMALPGQLTMEKTSNYFHNKKTVERIFNVSKSTGKNIKLIVVVREPVERTISDFLQRKLAQSEDGEKKYHTFEDTVIDSDTGEVKETHKIIKPSIYYKHMLKWRKYFGWENLHVVDGGNLILNPYQEVRKVEAFLKIPHCLTREKFVFSSTKGFYCVKKSKGRREETKCLPETKGRAHPEVDPEVMRKLKEFFKPLNERFFRIIGTSYNW